MNWTDLNLSVALPEIVLLSAMFGVLLADLWISDSKRCLTHWLSIGAVVLALAAQCAVWRFEPQYAFNKMYIADGVSQLAKAAMYIGALVLFVYSKPYNRAQGLFRGEYYTLTLFALVGMSVMVSAGHFLSAYVGLELLSLSLYAMIALRRDSAVAAEAALKYFVLGALASGLLLYGISMIYGATGSLEFAQVAASLASANGWLLKLGLLFVVVAVAFKFGAVPFHMWVPDVYQGSATSVTALVGSLPKIAATVFALRILDGALLGMHGDWMMMFGLIALVSLLVGNLAAIMQTNIKRMLAYSTVSHMGFVLLAFAGGILGLQAALYYAIAYVVMSLAGFGVLMLVSDKEHDCAEISDLAGLNQRNAWYAFIMLLVMFSMAGIPPLMGFYAKFVVLKSVLLAGHTWIAVFAVIMSLIGAFYYLRVVKTMYFDEQSSDKVLPGSPFALTVLSLNALLLLVWGVLPDSVMAVVAQAVEHAVK